MAIQDFIADIVIKVISNKDVQQSIKDILGQLITERIMPLVPVASAAAAVEAISNADLNHDGKPDIAQVTDAVTATLDRLIPDINFGIPALDQLADFWRPRG